MLNRLFLAGSVFPILMLSGCSHAADQAMAQQATRPGVYAITAAGLVEIPHYGAETLDGFSQEIKFKFDQPVVQAVAPTGFVTNIPNAVIDDAKVYLLATMEAGLFHKILVGPDDSKPIPSSASAISGSIYKVIPDLPSGATGFLCIWVKMPARDEDRLYAVRIK